MDSFKLTLDTTGPHIEVTGPAYSTSQSMVEILITSNEELGVYQDFYLLDSKGNRHDVIFNHQGDHFIGQLSFNDYPLGMATLFATVEDTVLNRSNQATHTIKITEQANVKVSVSSQSRPVIVKDSVGKVKVSTNKNYVAAGSIVRNVKAADKKRRIGVNDKNV